MATAPRLPSDPQPHPPTETGPLTGVANFIWNGTTWAASDGSGGAGGGDAVLGSIVTPSSAFTRPADTTVYGVGDLIANSVVAGSVVPLSWVAARVAAGSCYVRRVRLSKSTGNTANAIFRVHLYSAPPVGIVNGDNEARLTSWAGYCGAFDVQCYEAFTEGAWGDGVPIAGAEVNVVLPSGQTIYGLLEAMSSYAPVSGEAFTVTLEVQQN